MRKTISLALLNVVLVTPVFAANEADMLGDEDAAPRAQPLLNYDYDSISAAAWDQPQNRHYTYSNIEKVHPYPTIISRGSGPSHPLPVVENGMEYLKDFSIKPWKETDAMNLSRYLYETRADAFVVLKDGKLVYEAYPRQLRPDQTHSMFSASKTLSAMVITNLIAEGRLSLDTKIKDIIPELGTGFDGATLHRALNMNISMKFREDLQDPNSEGQRIFVAEGWGEGCEDDPEGVRGFLKSLTSEDTNHNPDNVTLYNSAVTSVLGWVIQRTTGMNYNYAVSYYLFKHVGAERNAIGLNDQTGYGHASGYIAFTPRDAARLYSAIGNDGVAPNGQRILPQGYVAMYIYGDKKATNYFFGTESDWKYSHQMLFNDRGGLAHLGYGGQLWYTNKETGVTIIQMGSIDSEGGAVTLNSANALLDMADKINELLKDKQM